MANGVGVDTLPVNPSPVELRVVRVEGAAGELAQPAAEMHTRSARLESEKVRISIPGPINGPEKRAGF